MIRSFTAPELEELLDLRTFVDEELERGLIEQVPLRTVLERLLLEACKRTGAHTAFVHSYGESLGLEFFSAGEPFAFDEKSEVFVRTGIAHRENVLVDQGARMLLAQPLDVAGEWFGAAGVVFTKPDDEMRIELAKRKVDLICEVLDNYLYAIKVARTKQRVMTELSHALSNRSLSEGLDKAASILFAAVPVDRLLIVYRSDESSSSDVQTHLYEGGRVTLNQHSSPELSGEGNEAHAYLESGDARLLDRYGILDASEEVLINGVTRTTIVGKLVARAKNAGFNTYDRELLSNFADFVRQRIVDFNKEWRHLSSTFRPEDVVRLLRQEDYERKYLAPREATVGILYMDIAGFTRLSEQVLKSPSAVARFVEEWSHDAVEILFDCGGAFDKMVGDCIIGLFGPPFYDQAPGVTLANAIRCAVEVREMTHAIGRRVGMEVLAKEPIGIATGVNLAPLFVGTFGPNRNFTGFSSGMNNTARLQGCAKRDEILVMLEALDALPAGHGFTFGEEGSAQVKNVAAPLRYRPLKTAPNEP